MPLYERVCSDGHKFEIKAKLENSDLPVKCPVCGQPSEKILSSPASVFPGADKWRK